MQDDSTDGNEDKVPDIPEQGMVQGVLPRLIKTLVERRRQVKSIMKNPSLSEAEMMQVRRD
jgi:DNA polymerase alpha subunit A